MLRQHGKLTHDHGKLAIVLHVEIEGDLVVSGRFGARDVLVIKPHARVGGLVHLQAVNDVLRRDRRAVMPARLFAEMEGDRGIVGGIGRPFGDQAVGGRGLIEAVAHQALEHEPEPSRSLSLVEHRVEAVEAADFGHAHDPALGRVGVHIVEMGEVGRIFRGADERERVMMDGRVLGEARCGDEAAEEESDEEAGKGHGSASTVRVRACFGGFVCGGARSRRPKPRGGASKAMRVLTWELRPPNELSAMVAGD